MRSRAAETKYNAERRVNKTPFMVLPRILLDQNCVVRERLILTFPQISTAGAFLFSKA
ncbi:MAG: hypothetical protein HC917_28660 [Richelia sp. SM2_1_7]|nr:hypothetical protein [Richelia sp. SM2_1_7]